MPLALSTRNLGRRPFTAATLLATLRRFDVRDCAISDAVPRPSGAELAAILKPAGAKVVAVEVRFEEADDGQAAPSLLTANREALAAAGRRVKSAAAVAAEVGCRLLVLRLGEPPLERRRERLEQFRARLASHGVDDETLRLARAIAHDVARREDADVERCCRQIYELARAEPELRFAIATPESIAGFPSIRATSLILGELRSCDVGYFHDVAAAALFERVELSGRGAYLGEHAAHCRGVALHDLGGADMYMPPGSGSIDFKALRGELPSGIPAILEIDSRYSPHEVELAISLLDAAGYR
jgi:sugar phosphate isomerase/epimerase